MKYHGNYIHKIQCIYIKFYIVVVMEGLITHSENIIDHLNFI